MNHKPHVGEDEAGNATLEWWSMDVERKLTLYTVHPTVDESLLKSWGTNIETEMEFVPLNDPRAVRAAFDWISWEETPAQWAHQEAAGGSDGEAFTGGESGIRTHGTVETVHRISKTPCTPCGAGAPARAPGAPTAPNAPCREESPAQSGRRE